MPDGSTGEGGAKTAERLQREAEFQNRRTLAEEGEARDRYYWVIQQAYADYDAAVDRHRGNRVLVVGCADGTVTPLASRGVSVVGVDISDEAIAKLRASIQELGLTDRAEAHVMDAEDLTFPDASFDAVVCSGVLHHLDVARACRSWQRVLKPGGEVLMVEPLALNPLVAVYRWLTPAARTPDEHPLLPADFRLLRRHFSRVEMRPYGLTSLASLALGSLAPDSRLRNGVLRGLDALDRALFRLVPPLRYAAWTSFVRCAEPRPLSASADPGARS